MLYSMLYLISVFQYYIRISDKSNLILRISNPASDFMFCLLIIIMIVYFSEEIAIITIVIVVELY